MNPSSLSAALFQLGVASAAFDVGCVLIKAPFLRSGVTIGDAIEAVGVFVVLALFARVARLSRSGGLPRSGSGGSPREDVVLGIAATAFAFGHGIHLAANSIHDLAARSGIGDPTGLISFWDEGAGHYLVDSARVLFAIALTSISWRVAASGGPRFVAAAVAGGIPFGFTVFASAVEGQTVPLVLPFTAIYAVWSVLARDARGGAVRGFFTSAACTSLLFFAVWGFWQRGFPEFTRAGIIRSAP